MKEDDLIEEAVTAAHGRKPNGDDKPKAEPKKPCREGASVTQHPRRGDLMLEAVYTFLGRFVSYPSKEAQLAHALWILHTHLMHLWDSTPRLAFLSPEPASGKSRALEVTELLVPSPVMAVNVSPAYLFRKVGDEDGPPTILFDEIDTVFGPKAKENEEIRGLLNAGHRRDAVAGRCVVHGKTVETEEIPAYSAVALAGLGWLPDTIMSRAVIVRMRRRHAGEKIESFRRRIHAAEGEKIRGLIETWARAQENEISWPDMPPGVEDRNADVWESLLAVANLVGGKWVDLARDAAVSLVSAAQDREASLGVRLLMDLKTAFGKDEAVFTKVLLQKLIALDEAPWGDLRGKPLDERGLAHRLRQYSINSLQVRLGDVSLKGYRREDFEDAWKRYVPLPPQRSETSETSETKPAKPSANVSDVSDSLTKNNSNFNAVSDVSDVSQLSPEGGGHRCAQCAGMPDGHEQQILVDEEPVWLHEQCERFYRAGDVWGRR